MTLDGWVSDRAPPSVSILDTRCNDARLEAEKKREPREAGLANRLGLLRAEAGYGLASGASGKGADGLFWDALEKSWF